MVVKNSNKKSKDKVTKVATPTQNHAIKAAPVNKGKINIFKNKKLYKKKHHRKQKLLPNQKRLKKLQISLKKKIKLKLNRKIKIPEREPQKSQRYKRRYKRKLKTLHRQLQKLLQKKHLQKKW